MSKMLIFRYASHKPGQDILRKLENIHKEDQCINKIRTDKTIIERHVCGAIIMRCIASYC